jgi:hypothetical protein
MEISKYIEIKQSNIKESGNYNGDCFMLYVFGSIG